MPTPYQPRWLDLEDVGARDAWDALVRASPFASPFSLCAYGDAVCDGFGLEPRLAVVERDGELAGGVLVFEKRKGPYRLAVVPPLTPYTPFVFTEPPRQADVHAGRSALDALIAHVGASFHASAFHLHPKMSDVRAFTWAGWRCTPRYTYRLALSSERPVPASFDRSSRRTLRRSEHEFELQGAAEGYDALLDLEASTFARKGMAPPVDPGGARAFFERLQASGLGRYFVLGRGPERTPAAAGFVTTDGTEAFRVSGAGIPGPAMTVLSRVILEHLEADGIETVDLVGANLAPVAEFKRAFGGTLTPYFRVVHYRRPELRALAAFRPVV